MEFLVQNALQQTANMQTTQETDVGHANIKVIGCGGGGDLETPD